METSVKSTSPSSFKSTQLGLLSWRFKISGGILPPLPLTIRGPGAGVGVAAPVGAGKNKKPALNSKLEEVERPTETSPSEPSCKNPEDEVEF